MRSQLVTYYLSLVSISLAIRDDLGDVSLPSDFSAWSPLQFISRPCNIRQHEKNISDVHMPNAAHQSLTEPSTCAGKFCVYSSPEFNNGRGITFITAKQAMDDIRTLPIFHAANETSGLQSKGPSPRLNGKPPSTQSESDDPPFRITEVPGKGLGVVATRPIVRGQRIMRHPPTVVVHRQFVDDLSEEEQARLLDSAIATLPSSTRDVFDVQVGHAGGSKVVDIMLTNSFEMSLAIPADRHHSGNFPEISRYNHDCRPKCVVPPN